MFHVLLSAGVKCFTTVAECSSTSSSDFFVAHSFEACCLDSRGFFARPNSSNDANCDECIGESPHLVTILLQCEVQCRCLFFFVFLFFLGFFIGENAQ